MNKEEFIEELGGRLAVLADDERRDILDEYEQHIDMKVMRGMSEEAAILDFGRLDELTADILEAYHVRADYAVMEKGKKKRGGRGAFFKGKRAEASHLQKEAPVAVNGETEGQQDDKQGVMEALYSAYEGLFVRVKHFGLFVRNFAQKGACALRGGLGKAGKLLWEAISELAESVRKPFRKRKAAEDERDGTESAALDLDGAPAKRRRKMKEKPDDFEGGFFTVCCRGFADAVRWCFRWMWNLFCIGIGLLFGFGSCLVIFTMGVLAVLLILGYPLVGVTIGWLGLTMCMVSVTIWFFSMIILKRKAAEGTDRAAYAGAKDRSAAETEAKEEMSHA